MNTKLFLAVVSASALFASSLALFACGDDEPNPAVAPKILWEAGTSNVAEQLEGGCNTSGIIIKGGASAGSACERASECTAVCCKCASGAKAWAAASCVSGACADEATACANTANDAIHCLP